MKGALFVTVLSALILSDDGYVTLLDYLPIESTCSFGYDVAMHHACSENLGGYVRV
ncbi:unnamed protein product [Arabidopsis halleri]